MQHHASFESLSVKQQRAVEALLAGSTVTEAATLAGVDRSTVHRWQNDAVFIAAFNAGANEAAEAARARLNRLSDKAMEIVESAVERGDLKTALIVLRDQRLLSGASSKPSSEDPGVIAKSQEAAKREAQFFDSLMSGAGFSDLE